ncbi:MAG: hypothetical protein JWS10_1563 [Cypionkella sp.]|uniref:hypothetical protein n=1 Tax=Cypionkella sp. TaxID=2811411 RepID=UPI00261DE31A|nr:hypothetical protein [Cypionkella sp.]MDB5658948.1 hypothetical protein [Cypionkella sp.]
MFRTFVCMAFLAASPAFSQTASDDQPSAENWWDTVGAGFFSDKGLTLLRSEHEIRAHWTGLSADDQAAVLQRCGVLAAPADATGSGSSVQSQQSGSNTEEGVTEPGQSADGGNRAAGEALPSTDDAATATPGTTNQTSITGATEGQEVHNPANGTEPYTGLAGSMGPNDDQFRSVCSVIARIH